MIDLIKICNDAFKTGNSIALLPSQGIFSTDGYFSQENVLFSQFRSMAGLDVILDSIDSKKIKKLRNFDFKDGDRTNLREFTSSLTGISKQNFLNSDLAVVKFDSKKIYKNKSHDDDIKFLNWLSKKVFHALDIVRFFHCDLAIPDRLPLIPGYWNDSNGYMGCIVVSPNGNNKIIAGRQMGGEINFGLGIGLEESDAKQYTNHHPLPLLKSIDHQCKEVNEVGTIIRHSLRMYSKAMYSNNETMKFILCMALFEHLGSGNKYTSFKKIRIMLQAHLAKNIIDHEKLTETFRTLTSKIVDGKNIGYRTRIIHEGAFIEEIIPDEFDRRILFGKLSAYIEEIITSMYNYTNKTLDELQQIRKQLTKNTRAKT